MPSGESNIPTVEVILFNEVTEPDDNHIKYLVTMDVKKFTPLKDIDSVRKPDMRARLGALDAADLLFPSAPRRRTNWTEILDIREQVQDEIFSSFVYEVVVTDRTQPLDK